VKKNEWDEFVVACDKFQEFDDRIHFDWERKAATFRTAKSACDFQKVVGEEFDSCFMEHGARVPVLRLFTITKFLPDGQIELPVWERIRSLSDAREIVATLKLSGIGCTFVIENYSGTVEIVINN
jgi:hypothetical protein